MLRLADTTQLIISDVDDTLAHPYCPASDAIIEGLDALLARGIRLFLISGQGAGNIGWRVVERLEPQLRSRILLGTCSGAEVWGYDTSGALLEQPFYSVYENSFTPTMKALWRETIAEVIERFGLVTHPTMPKHEFYKAIGTNVFDIMYEDRGPQITFEMCNACKMNLEQQMQILDRTGLAPSGPDLRPDIIAFANELFAARELPVTARMAGNIAIDFAVVGATKRIAVEFGLFSDACETYFGLALAPDNADDLAQRVEIWGDKFSITNGGTDRHICEALPGAVRAIDFRKEDPAEFPPEFNIQIWDGEHELCAAVEEYLTRAGAVGGTR